MPEDKPENQEKEKDSDIEQITKKVEAFTETVIKLIAKNIAKYTPAIGSGALFVNFVHQQQWLMALLTSFISIPAVMWIKYSQGVLTRLGEIYDQKGKDDVDFVMTWINKADKAIKWQLTGVEDNYLQCQGNACNYYATEGTSSIFRPLLKDVFVPLELSAEFIQNISGERIPNPRGYQWDKHLVKLMNQQDGLTIWDVLKRVPSNPNYRTLAILAWGGYGKTTLLRYIAYSYAQKKLRRGVPKLLPVLILLRSQQKVIFEEKLDLVTLIEQYHLPSLPNGRNLKYPPNWAKNQLNQGKMLVMFDGFDEVKEEWRQEVGNWIANMMNDYSSSYFILTSRPAGYKSYQAQIKPNILRLKAFNEAQREKFINQWYLSRERHISANPDNPMVKQTAQQKSANLVQQLKERKELNDLARNPLLLNMIVNLHSVAPVDYSDLSRPIQLPKRRSQLYREIFKLQLGDRPLVKQIAMCIEAEKSESILRCLALYMVQENKPEIEESLLKTQLNTIIEQLQQEDVLDEDVDIKKFLQQMIDVSELLVKKDENYEFAHLSFQGYLAAKKIIDTKQESLLIENWDKSWWRETILLYAAQVNPNNLLRQLIKIGSKKALTLALRCKEETPRKIDEEVNKTLSQNSIEKQEEFENIVNQIEDALFQDLETYLANQQWRQADKETDKLMLQLGDKEEKGYLSIEDCRNFPKKELRTIDKLWLKYSDGKFGSSVQKEIYLEELGIKELIYNYEAYKRIGDRIGWREKEQWLSHFNLKVNILPQEEILQKAPKGHLPLMGFIGGIQASSSDGFLEGLPISFLFSRL